MTPFRMLLTRCRKNRSSAVCGGRTRARRSGIAEGAAAAAGRRRDRAPDRGLVSGIAVNTRAHGLIGQTVCPALRVAAPTKDERIQSVTDGNECRPITDL